MTQNAAIMQNLMEVLTSAGINLRQNVSLQQQGIVEQLQNISMQSPPSPPNHAFCIQVTFCELWQPCTFATFSDWHAASSCMVVFPEQL